jgi:hypothetical protein
MTQEELIAANAEMVKGAFPDEGLELDERSIKWLDGYIDRVRESLDEVGKRGLANTIGSFLGEAIRAEYGGDWESTENGLAIRFSDGNACFPFNKVRKHLDNGPEDSIASFYSTMGSIFSLNNAS